MVQPSTPSAWLTSTAGSPCSCESVVLTRSSEPAHLISTVNGASCPVDLRLKLVTICAPYEKKRRGAVSALRKGSSDSGSAASASHSGTSSDASLSGPAQRRRACPCAATPPRVSSGYR
eukprot:6206348-Pleurochrysis_carterae.AAC.2